MQRVLIQHRLAHKNCSIESPFDRLPMIIIDTIHCMRRETSYLASQIYHNILITYQIKYI